MTENVTLFYRFAKRLVLSARRSTKLTWNGKIKSADTLGTSRPLSGGGDNEHQAMQKLCYRQWSQEMIGWGMDGWSLKY